ncbi:O-methyltransferase [Actinomyces vulturis]|uniref:O-methyltransferase n=1 Tax=Actinomyces vulturis TaxID=1857645 RepID=UPI0008339EC6|nr:O-methyltransferase [Actinomyces vulturis]
MSADKNLTWSFTEEVAAQDDMTSAARVHASEIGATAVSAGEGAVLRMLAAATGAKAIAEVGTGAGVSGLWLLAGMGDDGVLTTIDVEPEFQREARKTFAAAGYPSSRTRIIGGRALDVMPRMAARSYDMVVLDAEPRDTADMIEHAIRMLRHGGVLVITRALYNGNVADPAKRDEVTVAMRELGKDLRAREDVQTTLLPTGDGLLVCVKTGA